MRYASIDVGTNTLRLLVAEHEGTELRPVIYRRVITRLGGCYSEASGIDQAAAERTFAALEGFRRELDSAGASTVLAFATSVVRRARNRQWFMDEAKRRAGIDITVISGGEEARLALQGVLSVMDDLSGRKLVMDVGGGSTEFIAADSGIPVGEWSMDMGVVHLTERHLESDPLSGAELAAMEGEIGGVISDLRGAMAKDGVDPAAFSGGQARFIGTAGTITTLAALDQGLERYDRARINNYRLGRDRVQRLYGRLTALTLSQRKELLNLEKGREDLIIPGAAIILRVMESFGFGEVMVSDAGLLEGIILDRLRPGAVTLRY